MEQEFIEAFEGLFNTIDQNKYNIAMGFFQNYATVDSDASGVRYCDLKLHYKDADSNDIPITGVPLMYFGNQKFILDFELSSGDELLVLFTDRTLEDWKAASAIVPQLMTNPVKDSLNHAIAIPVCTAHYASTITTSALDSTVGARVGVQTGKKVQIGTDVVDLLKILYDLITALLVGTTVATPNTLTGTGVFTNAAAITALQAQLAIITKIT